MDIVIPENFNAAEYFIDRNIAEGRGEHSAIEYEDNVINYDEVLSRVNKFGNAFRDLGLKKGDRVLLLLLDCPEFAYSFFGAIKIGAVPIPVNTLLLPDNYEYILNDSEAKVAIVSESLMPKVSNISKTLLPHLKTIITIKEDIFNEYSNMLVAEKTQKNDVAFWLYSSGSTGAPKACVHLQHDMVVCAEHYAKEILGITSKDRFFSASKLFFAYGLGNALYFPFSVGGTSILLSSSPKPEAISTVIKKYKPTLFFSVPSNYAALLDHADQNKDMHHDLSSIRHAISAGEALPEGLFKRFKEKFNIEILDGIGSTEALQTFISNAPGSIRPGSSGKIVPGYEAKVSDDNGVQTPIGEIGNLFIKNDAVCAYYWNQPEKTKSAFQDGWLRTGDKYRQDSDGYFWYVGRSDDMMKCSGIWVSPIEIESVLFDHPAVLESAVVGELDANELMKPVAYVALRSGFQGTPELAQELKEFVTSHLPNYKRPRRIEFVDELPKTATGKIQRFKLRPSSSIL